MRMGMRWLGVLVLVVVAVVMGATGAMGQVIRYNGVDRIIQYPDSMSMTKTIEMRGNSIDNVGILNVAGVSGRPSFSTGLKLANSTKNTTLVSDGLDANRTYVFPTLSPSSVNVATIDGGQTFTSAVWNGTRLGKSYVPTVTAYTDATNTFTNDQVVQGTLTVGTASSTAGKVILTNPFNNLTAAIQAPSSLGTGNIVATYPDVGAVTLTPTMFFLDAGQTITNATWHGAVMGTGYMPANVFYTNGAQTVTSGVWNGTVMGVVYGGTGFTSYTQGDMIYASGSTTLAKLNDVGTGNVLLSGGTGVAPAYGKVGLTTHVSGTLAAGNGGTGQTTYTVGDLIYASGSAALSKLAGVATGNVLISGGTSTAPAWGKVDLTTHVSGVLPTANGGTGQSINYLTPDSIKIGGGDVIKNISTTSYTTPDSVIAPGGYIELGFGTELQSGMYSYYNYRCDALQGFPKVIVRTWYSADYASGVITVYNSDLINSFHMNQLIVWETTYTH